MTLPQIIPHPVLYIHFRVTVIHDTVSLVPGCVAWLKHTPPSPCPLPFGSVPLHTTKSCLSSRPCARVCVCVSVCSHSGMCTALHCAALRKDDADLPSPCLALLALLGWVINRVKDGRAWSKCASSRPPARTHAPFVLFLFEVVCVRCFFTCGLSQLLECCAAYRPTPPYAGLRRGAGRAAGGGGCVCVCVCVRRAGQCRSRLAVWVCKDCGGGIVCLLQPCGIFVPRHCFTFRLISVCRGCIKPCCYSPLAGLGGVNPVLGHSGQCRPLETGRVFVVT